MIVRQFLQWVRTAPPGERAEATSALARAYLYSDLSADDRAAAEGAMIMLLDDPSPLVRRALAEVFAVCAEARRASWCMRSPTTSPRSPMPMLAALAAAARRRSGRRWSPPAQPAAQVAIAVARHAAVARCRPRSPRSAAREACLALLENPDADIASFSLDRIVERFGHLARDPRSAAGARRPAGGDAPGAAVQAVADARRLRRRARNGSGPSTPNTPRARPARRRPSRSPPRRRTRKSAN